MRSNSDSSSLMDYQTFKKIADGIMGNILVSDKNGKVFFCNRHCADVFGTTESELLKINVHQMYEEGVIDKTAASSESLTTKKTSVRYIKTQKGVGMLIHCQPIFDENGELEMVVAFSHEERNFKQFVEQIEAEKNHLQTVLNYLDATKESQWFVHSENYEMQKLYQLAFMASHSDSTVSIYGESGTGKEVLARFIHRNSPRASKAFIPVNCAAIPAELVESEFFGYSGYAFTGANKQGKAGIFEIANNGTLFLDEIGELPLSIQSKLLRVLETGEIRRVGSTKLNHTNARIIVATNRNLAELIKEGKFRKDLFYRLNVIPLNVPPLRNRREDIIPLSNSFLEQLNRKYKTNHYLSEATCHYLIGYDWPGNVRELKNIIERLMVIATDNELQIENVVNITNFTPGSQKSQSDYDAPSTGSENTKVSLMHSDRTLKEATIDFQHAYINHAIKQCNGNMTAAAKILGIHRSNLYKLLQKSQMPE